MAKTRTKRVRTQGQTALRKMRTRWYLWSILPGLLILAATAYVVYIIQWNAYGLEKYQDGDLRNSIWSFQHTGTWLPAERWVHPYNIATAQVKQGAYRGATTNFERAETLAPALDPNESFVDHPASMLPPLCKIRINHAGVYSHQAETARKEANLFWDSVKAQHDTGRRASTEERYNQHMETAREHLEQAVEQYQVTSEAFGEAIRLLGEYQCLDPKVTDSLQDEKTFADNRITDAAEIEEPDWRPRSTPQNNPEQPTDPDNPSDEPSNDPSESPDDEPTDEPSNDPSESPDDEPTDEPGEGETERPQHNYTPEERDRQHQLQERNKNGTVQREEADGNSNTSPPSTKQW